MKTKIFSFKTYILLLFASILFSCRQASHNGDIDGFWQLTTIKDKKNNTETKPEGCYLSFYEDLMSLQKNGICLGRFSLSNDSLKINMLKGDLQFVSNFGFDSLNQSFGINKLNSRSMILETESKIIIYRKW